VCRDTQELSDAKLRLSHQDNLLRLFSHDVAQVGEGEEGGT
jgi:hypothetical protein